MDRYLQRSLIKHTFWVALLLHMLLLLSFSVEFLFPIKKMEKGPELYTPSYIYHGDLTQPSRPSTASEKSQPKQPPPQTKVGDIKQVQSVTPKKTTSLNSSNATPISVSQSSEPVQMIGDKNVKKPLLTLLGKAFSKHLVFPKAAMDFNLRGIALIGFVLHPDGTITNAEVVQSSKAGVLDAAALTAVTASSPVNNVNLYVKQPQYLVVGVIFGYPPFRM